MNKEIIFFFVALIFLLLSCRNNDTQSQNTVVFENEVVNSSKRLIFSRDIIFELDSNISNSSVSYQIFQHKGEEFLAFINGVHIYYYSLYDQQKSGHITLMEDENGLGRVINFHIINLDSVILTTRHQLHIVNSESEKIYSYNFLNYSRDNNLVDFGINFGTGEIQYSKGKIAFLAIPLLRPTDYNRLKKLNQLIAVLNLSKDSVSVFSGYPSEVVDNVYPFIWFMKPFLASDAESNFYLSYGASHSIHWTDGKTSNSIIAQSKSVKHLAESDLVSIQDPRKRELHLRTNSRYGQILYDPFRNLFLRAVYHGVSLEQFSTRDWWSSPSLMILSDSLTILGESSTVKNTSQEHMLICEEGLLVRESIPTSENLIFKLFKIIDHEK